MVVSYNILSEALMPLSAECLSLASNSFVYAQTSDQIPSFMHKRQIITSDSLSEIGHMYFCDKGFYALSIS